MVDNVTKLDDEQMQSLAKMVAEQMLAANKNEKPGDEDPGDENSSQVQGGQPPQLSAEDLVNKIMQKLEMNTAGENKKVFEMMWRDKFNQSVSNVPGLEDFINGEDDYGFVRKEKLESIEDLQDRVAALNKLTNSYKEASAGNANRRPVVNTKAKQKAEEAQSEYDKLNEKMSKGEYNNTAEMTNDFFSAFAKEIEGLT